MRFLTPPDFRVDAKVMWNRNLPHGASTRTSCTSREFTQAQMASSGEGVCSSCDWLCGGEGRVCWGGSGPIDGGGRLSGGGGRMCGGRLGGRCGPPGGKRGGNMAPGGGRGAHTGERKRSFIVLYFYIVLWTIWNQKEGTAYLASWEVPQVLLQGKTQEVVVHKVPCVERDHPWGQVGVQEVVGLPSVDQCQVMPKVTHIEKVKCDKSKHTDMLCTHKVMCYLSVFLFTWSKAVFSERTVYIKSEKNPTEFNKHFLDLKIVRTIWDTLGTHNKQNLENTVSFKYISVKHCYLYFWSWMRTVKEPTCHV